ncbi:CRISPR-associated endonuclease Cas2 [Limosilactobacillus sp.]|uniref:CRISPR-associated endonuclease Cas2 n=1 Tax=Limosilactobacillus sp. TaxID=2773925 RepID=UPI003F00DF52
MRLLIMFDLPVETSKQRKAYRRFRKDLINEGFTMIQYSVYVRVCVNRKSAQFIENRISEFLPEAGIIQSLMLTEKQYNDMHFLLGKEKIDVRNFSGRTVVL